MSQRSHRRADVVILTATLPELDAVLEVDAGAVAGSSWEEATVPSGLPVFYRRFNGKGARPLRVAAAVARDMGAPAAANTLLPLIEALEPRCIAMCGVCAGRRGKVQLGDVIAPDRLYYHDTGKQLPGRVEQDLTTYKLRDDWKVALERMDPIARFRGEHWFHERPLTTEWRLYSAMVALRDEVPEPWAVVDPAPGGAEEWPLILAALRARKMLATSGRRLTKAGHRFVEDLLLRHRNALPDLSPTGKLHPFRLHVAPIGTGARVIEDERIWTFVSQAMRKTLGIEMEAAVIGEVVHRQRHRKLDWIVMKGVMDFAEHGRDDHFKEYAARASAECLLWFLREHLATDPVAGFDDVLTSGTLALPPSGAPPSMLLAAPFAVVPWHQAGRADVMAEFDRWADDPSRAVAVRLLHAEGGVGKTRLAIEWLRRRRGEDGESDRRDIAGFLPPKPANDWLERLCALSAPVVIAVDYAETRADLVAVLVRVAAAARTSKQERRIRVLLLARSDGDWWDALLERELALEALLTAQEPIELRPLAMEAVERQAVFEEALVAFAKHRKRPVPRAQISAGDPLFDRVLYLHTAALAAVERNAEPASAGNPESAVVLEAGELMDKILDHEQRFWLRDRRDRKRAALSLARQIVAAATLRGGIALETEAQQLCKRLFGRERTDTDDELLALLHDVYAVDEGGLYLPGLQPDLLGEAMVLRVATKQADEKWIARAIVDGDDAEAVGNVFTVLGRAAAVNAAAISPWLVTLLRTELALRALPAVRSAVAVGQRTAFSPLGDLLAGALERDGTAAMALTLASELIPPSTVSLRRVAEWRSRVLLANTPTGDDPETLAERAALLSDWGIRLGYLGQREAALDATREAVKAYRELATKHPEASLPGLAGSLTNLGAMLSVVGQRDPALAATQEAVNICRALAAANPDAFAPDFAMSLNSLGNQLSALGQREAALAAAQEAVDHYRTLVATTPDAFTPDLAHSLNNLGARLSALGQRETALAATQEAMDHYRTLAAHSPDAFTPDLAMCLNNLGAMLSALDQCARALAATQEAVDHYRALAATNPSAFTPDLAHSLNNLGNRLSALGQRKAAMAATQEAVDHYRALAVHNPDAFIPYVARSLNNLGAMLSALGERERALIITQEAADHYRALAATAPDAFTPDLARSLNNLGADLSALGQREPALAATQEAVDHHHSLAAKHPDAFLPDLATSLDNLAGRLTETGDHDAANAALREATEIRRTLQAKTPPSDDEGGSA